MEFKYGEATYFEDLIALAEENLKRKKKDVDPLMLTTAQTTASSRRASLLPLQQLSRLVLSRLFRLNTMPSL
jgi:hypothetical protein